MKPLIDVPTRLPMPMLVGMVHVRALPGTPFCTEGIDRICEIAVAEARMFQSAGFDGIILENMHDRPYLKGRVGPEITAAMARIASEVKKAVGLHFPVGIQILAGANVEALAVAHIAGCDFIRAEGCIFAHVADEGVIEACAGALMRERVRIGAERVRIWGDIQKKHSAHAITADLSITDWVHAADFFGLDGVIVTGKETGKSADKSDLLEAKKASRIPVIIGSGVTAKNIGDYMNANALIIGSSLKVDGFWANPLDPDRIKAMVEARNKLLK